jgi:hypothetical protein
MTCPFTTTAGAATKATDAEVSACGTRTGSPSGRRGLRRVWVVLALSALLPLVSAGVARADDEADQARAYHEKAKAAFALSHYSQAAEFFEKAFELKSDPALLYNAAQSHRLAGNKERALTLYQNYLHVYGRDDRRAQIETRISELKKAIDRDRTEVPAPPPSNWPPGTRPPTGTSSAAAPPPVVESFKSAAPAVRSGPPAPVAVAPVPVTAPPPSPPPSLSPPAPASDPPAPVLLTQNGARHEEEKSLTQKTWFWVAVGGGVAAAAAVVLMVALGGSKDPSASLGQAHGN